MPANKVIPTFEQFQATAEEVPNVEYVAQDDESRPGVVYADHTLYIEQNTMPQPKGKWLVLLGRTYFESDDLAELERKLYEYAVTKDLLDPVADGWELNTVDGVPQLKRLADNKTFDVATAPRAVLIAYCMWNDPNGCYTDEDMRAEFGHTSLDSELRTIITIWSRE